MFVQNASAFVLNYLVYIRIVIVFKLYYTLFKRMKQKTPVIGKYTEDYETSKPKMNEKKCAVL